MKKEGTGEPQNPDISLDADVRMRELSFDRASNSEVRFRGNTRRNSVWGSRRENLPDEVREGVVYRDAGVRLRIATEMASAEPGSWNRSDSEGVRIGSEYPNRTNAKPSAADAGSGPAAGPGLLRAIHGQDQGPDAERQRPARKLHAATSRGFAGPDPGDDRLLHPVRGQHRSGHPGCWGAGRDGGRGPGGEAERRRGHGPGPGLRPTSLRPGARRGRRRRRAGPRRGRRGRRPGAG